VDGIKVETILEFCDGFQSKRAGVSSRKHEKLNFSQSNSSKVASLSQNVKILSCS